MVKLFTVERGEMIETRMRGNFVKIVSKERGESKVVFVNGKGDFCVLEYDVQAAVLDMFTETVSRQHLAVTRGDELITLRTVLKERDAVIAQLKEDRRVQVGTGNITLGGFVAWGERVKDLFFKVPKP